MKLLSRSAEETSDCGVKLGRILKAGNVVRLIGELGSGKTTFVRGVASALNIPGRDITSASFTIIAEYHGIIRGKQVPFYHMDLYRINDASELDSIGLEEYIGGDGICIIEWAEKLGAVEGSIAVKIDILGAQERRIGIEGIDEEDWDSM